MPGSNSDTDTTNSLGSDLSDEIVAGSGLVSLSSEPSPVNTSHYPG